MINTNSYTYGLHNLPVESNFKGAEFTLDGINSFRVTDCVESESFYSITDNTGTVIRVPIKSVEDLFDGKSVDVILNNSFTEKPGSLTLVKPNVVVQNLTDGEVDLSEDKGFSIADWRRKFLNQK